jgi:predicted amidohydrolase YtcJ
MRTNVFLLLMLGIMSCTKDDADIILTNGKIFTADTAQLYAQAVAIKGNRILVVGSNDAVAKLADDKTVVIDLQGKTVIPGFNDAHDHLGWSSPPGVGFSSPFGDLQGPDKATVLDSIVKWLAIAEPGQWVGDWIGTRVLFDMSMRAALDSLAPENPVVLQAWWGHGQVINQKALDVSGIADTHTDPLGGRYIRNPKSNKINTIFENAQVPVWNAWMKSDPIGQKTKMRAYADRLLQVGVTTVQQMSSTFSRAESEQIFFGAALPQRIRVIAWPSTSSRGREMDRWKASGDPVSPMVYFSGVKYMVDGTPTEGNSFNKTPYPDGSYGVLNFPVDTLRQILTEALHSDQVMLHITGDSSLSLVLSLMKELADSETWKAKRVRIEHNPTSRATEAEIDAIRDMGLIMMHTPVYNRTSRIRSLLRRGIPVGVAPDGIDNPFWEIMVITTQQSDPNENITREEAVIAYTRTNAYAEFMEKDKGTLSAGMLADLAVLSQDIFTVDANKLPATTSLLTIVNGQIVFRSEALP